MEFFLPEGPHRQTEQARRMQGTRGGIWLFSAALAGKGSPFVREVESRHTGR